LLLALKFLESLALREKVTLDYRLSRDTCISLIRFTLRITHVERSAFGFGGSSETVAAYFNGELSIAHPSKWLNSGRKGLTPFFVGDIRTSNFFTAVLVYAARWFDIDSFGTQARLISVQHRFTD